VSCLIVKVVHRVANFIAGLIGRVFDGVTNTLDVFAGAFNRVAGNKGSTQERHAGE
jgi:hypothetical protein